jgi:hypothetical protein
MIHEEICTYEVAKLAKEKGFDVPTAKNYRHESGETCNAPTQSLLQRWLREEKGIYIAMFPNMANSFASDYIVYTKGDKFWNPVYTAHSEFDTYELALEDALARSLKKLV